MVQASQVTARVNLLYIIGSLRPLGMLLKGDYSAAVVQVPVFSRGSSAAAFTLTVGSGLTKTLKANVYYNAETGDVKYAAGAGYQDLGQYTEVLINPSALQRSAIAVKHEYQLRFDGEPLVSGLISANVNGGEAGERGCISSPDLDVLIAPNQDLVVLVGMPAPALAETPALLNNTVGDGLVGAVDGVNLVFTLPRVTIKAKTVVSYEGLRTTDFNVAGVTLTMGFAPEVGIPFVVDLF